MISDWCLAIALKVLCAAFDDVLRSEFETCFTVVVSFGWRYKMYFLGLVLVIAISSFLVVDEKKPTEMNQWALNNFYFKKDKINILLTIGYSSKL